MFLVVAEIQTHSQPFSNLTFIYNSKKNGWSIRLSSLPLRVHLPYFPKLALNCNNDKGPAGCTGKENTLVSPSSQTLLVTHHLHPPPHPPPLLYLCSCSSPNFSVSFFLLPLFSLLKQQITGLTQFQQRLRNRSTDINKCEI